MEKNLAKTYDPKEFETRIYEEWESNGAFKPGSDRTKEPFTIVMPPPNITGVLHMGHALDQTLQDVLIRWRRMQGYNALWIPGSDHASIATEVKVVDKVLKEEGKIDFSLSADVILQKIRAFTPFPSSFAEHNGTAIKIWDAHKAQGCGDAGSVLQADKHGVVIACGQDAICATVLQRPGKPKMPVESFLQGYPFNKGDTFQ